MKNKVARVALLGLVALSTTVAAFGPVASGTAHADPYLDGAAQVANGQVPPADFVNAVLNPPPAPSEGPLAPYAEAARQAEGLQSAFSGREFSNSPGAFPAPFTQAAPH